MTIQLLDMTFFACYFYIEDRALSQNISYLCYPESADKHVFGRYFISFQSQRVKHVCKIVIDNNKNVFYCQYYYFQMSDQFYIFTRLLTCIKQRF